MRVVEATWERRNLGRIAFEVSLDKKDCGDIGGVIAQLGDLRFRGAYVTLKMPVGELAAFHELEDYGFRFLETQLGMRYDLTKYSTPEAIRKFVEPVSIREVPHDRSQWEAVVGRISPDLFRTDRISLDPAFGPDVGCQRYRNWIMDLLDRADAHLLIFSNPENPNEDYGFTIDIFDEKIGVVKGLLGGVFPDCDKAGIGISMYDASFRNHVARGGRILESAISSNNPAVLAVDSALGVYARKLTYVLRKLFD